MNPSSADRAPRLVLGIDPGSSVMGWGLVRRTGGGVEAVEYGVLRPARASLPLSARLASLFSQLEALLQRLRPERVAVEGVFAHRNVRSALALAHARGVVLLAVERSGLPVREIAPRLVKQAVAGSGGAPKEQVAAMVRLELRLGEGPLLLDASDALAIALCEARSTAFLGAVEAASAAPSGAV